jgi:hypothetical protein
MVPHQNIHTENQIFGDGDEPTEAARNQYNYWHRFEQQALMY